MEQKNCIFRAVDNDAVAGGDRVISIRNALHLDAHKN